MEGISSGAQFALSLIIIILGYLFRTLINWIREGNNERDQNEMRVQQQRYEDCPICLSRIVNRVMSTCTHDFCAECITQIWQRQQNIPQIANGIQCPICRRVIKMFYIDFEENSNNSQFFLKIKMYNTLYSDQPKSLLTKILALPQFLVTLSTFIFCTHQGRLFFFRLLTGSFKVILILIYILSPFDFIPEAVFGVIGFFDDFVVIIILLLSIMESFQVQHLQQQ